MKKLLTFAAIGILSSVEVFAADIGVGVDLNAGSNTIYVPINLSKEFRIEPYFSTQKTYDEDDYSYRYSKFGVGFFKVTEVADKTNLILGARAAYIDGHHSYDNSDFDGYSVAPVLGFEYFPVKNISVGADVSIEYGKIDDDGYKSSTSGTKTGLALKYYF